MEKTADRSRASMLKTCVSVPMSSIRCVTAIKLVTRAIDPDLSAWLRACERKKSLF